VIEIIASKQAGRELTPEQIAEFVQGAARGSVPDYQLSALLMAIYFQGMSRAETTALTRAMADSGVRVDLSSVPGRKVDKHSTGGVGDKVSLVAAPLAAALGVPVPMMSGRGLGHTGGTLDKLESIPGFTTRLTVDQFVRQVAEIGCALIGQSEALVPADRKLYALRDVTSTVHSLPLITASILSKKIAEGTDALLLDVKFGRGAVFPEPDQARRLARTLVETGSGLGLHVEALLTDMDQPLGRAVGNWLEVLECRRIMRGEDDAPDLKDLCLAQAARMLVLGGRAEDDASARALAQAALDDGRAWAKFREIVRRQGGDGRFLDEPDLYPEAACQAVLEADRDGFVAGLDARFIGQAAVHLGAGRRRQDDAIDYTAGIILHRKRGDAVREGEALATLHAADEARLEAVLPAVAEAFEIADTPPPPRPLILERVAWEG